MWILDVGELEIDHATRRLRWQKSIGGRFARTTVAVIPARLVQVGQVT
jgi:hypothetical protein